MGVAIDFIPESSVQESDQACTVTVDTAKIDTGPRAAVLPPVIGTFIPNVSCSAKLFMEQVILDLLPCITGSSGRQSLNSCFKIRKISSNIFRARKIFCKAQSRVFIQIRKSKGFPGIRIVSGVLQQRGHVSDPGAAIVPPVIVHLLNISRTSGAGSTVDDIVLDFMPKLRGIPVFIHSQIRLNSFHRCLKSIETGKGGNIITGRCSAHITGCHQVAGIAHPVCNIGRRLHKGIIIRFLEFVKPSVSIQTVGFSCRIQRPSQIHGRTGGRRTAAAYRIIIPPGTVLAGLLQRRNSRTAAGQDPALNGIPVLHIGGIDCIDSTDCCNKIISKISDGSIFLTIFITQIDITQCSTDIQKLNSILLLLSSQRSLNHGIKRCGLTRPFCRTSFVQITPIYIYSRVGFI